jgi:threonyl-tRNA synthetase
MNSAVTQTLPDSKQILPDEDLMRMRHSCAHVMAAAVQKLFPGAHFGVGPAIKDGFFYDILTAPLMSSDDLKGIEAEMRRIKGANLPFERFELPIDEAFGLMEKQGQEFKIDLLRLLRDRGTTAVSEETGDDAVGLESQGGVQTVSFYKLGDFIDLCRGPHVERSGQVGEFSLTHLAGAYWRGKSDNPQLQRVYGLCYRRREEVDHRKWQIEERRKRDHRRIGKDLKLFTFAEAIGPGLPLWLPRGRVLRDELERLAREEERRDGYQAVSTPELTKAALYYRSRHLPYYAEDMYAPMDIEGEQYYLRPMNCPHHHEVYLSEPKSYRELPYRVAEYGTVYRYEASGALSGLMRTRGFTQNDAHIYCRYDQAKDEFLRVMRLHERYYRQFEIDNFYMRLALPDLARLDKYIDQPEKWEAALKILRQAMDESGLPYVEAKGEAAFYGPKVDFMIESAVGTEFAISTNQLDFLATETFDLKYTGEDGALHPVYVIHRAPLGSHERFVAFLIEHYGGAFPVWLSPVQARVIPISDTTAEYGEEVARKVFAADVPTATGGLRVDVDRSADRMQKKIRNAQLEKIPYMLVVGEREKETGQVAVRLRSGKDLGPMQVENFLARIREDVVTRKQRLDEN